MKRGNIIRIFIDRAKYGLPPSTRHYSNILIGTIIDIHKHKVSVKTIDIWHNGAVKHMTIDKEEVVAVL